MAIRADRVGVREDQVDIHGRVTSPSFFNELLEDLPEWTDMPVWVNGTEELLPSNNSVPVTSPIRADIAYPDIRRDNQYFTYRESPTHVDGLAKIKSIKGNTLVWNQQIDSSQYRTGTYSDVAVTKSADETYLIANGTASATAYIRLLNVASVPMISGHKYCCIVPTDQDVAYYDDTSPRQYNNQYSSFIFTSNGSPIHPYARISSGVASTNRRISFMMFDLTQMGLDSLTDAEILKWFADYFPLSFYSYNQGSLLSFMGSGIKTVGFNQWDEDWELGAFNSGTGLPIPNSNAIRSKNFIPVFPSATYYFYLGTSGITVNPFFYDADKNYIGRLGSYIANTTFVIPDNAHYMKIGMQQSYGTTYNNDICINISDQSKNGTYEPYTSSTLSLPISTYFPTGMKSAGNVYDELTPIKAITKIGILDLGLLDWTYQPNGRFVSRTQVVGAMPNGESAANICSTLYTGATATQTSSDLYDMVASFGVSDTLLLIRNSNFTDATAFKTAMSGVYLYYELATPVELPTMSFE